MAVLIVGLVIFLGAHSFHALMPGNRKVAIGRLGEQGYKGVFSIVSLIGLALIIWGFGRAAANPVTLYAPPFWLRHLTEALMLLALVLAIASAVPAGYIARFFRHPLLIATILWATAHLIVNGEIATTLLFGAFLVWAIFDLVAQKGRLKMPRAAPSWRFDVVAVVVAAVVYGLLVWRVHLWLFGVSPIV